MGNSKYLEQWKNLMLQASEALGQKKFADYENLMMQVNNAYDNYKNDASLQYECVNFGMANYIFEDALPDLFIKSPQLIKEFITLIKEDKNLENQYLFYQTLKKCNQTSIKDYVSDALRLVKEGINVKTLSKSNKKLADFITKHDLKPSTQISETNLNLFESCDYLFKQKQTLSNLNEMTQHNHTVCEFVEERMKLNNNDDKSSIASLLEKVDSSESILTEEERGVVRDILDWRANDDSKKRKLYDKFKNECLQAIEKMLNEASLEDKEGLVQIKEQLNKQEFCAETLVADIAKLLEIRDILLSE